MAVKFYDTCALLDNFCALSKSQEKICICDVTLQELENIKTSSHRDTAIKYKARKVLHYIKDNEDKIEVLFAPMDDNTIVGTNDELIILCAAKAYQEQKIYAFVTSDLACYFLAKNRLSTLSVQFLEPDNTDEYLGYKKIQPTDEELAAFYENPFENTYNLLFNQYLIICDSNGKEIDSYVWKGDRYDSVTVSNRNFESTLFGKVQAFDVYQRMAMHSFVNNQITCIRGPAGSGKSYLALAYLASMLERNKIDKIIIFCNTVAAADSAKLGYYPGDKNEKLLDSQIGNFLSSKFGSLLEVEHWIQQEKLILLPMSDIRGYDTSQLRAGIYITEAQNTNDTLMRLALTRVGEDCICILDGDDREQVDMQSYSGANNGLKRASEVFRGDECYGEVMLPNIYRSHIASLASQI